MQSESLTIRSLVLGALLATLLGAANAYLGLYAGLTVSASIPAAVLGMGLLRMLGGAPAREVNLVQTAASSGEALAAGVIFTFPALLMIHYWSQVDPWSLTVIALGGGLLGILASIPLRRLLVNDAALPFPEGRATAEVVRLSEAPETASMRHLSAGALGAALFKVLQGGVGLWPGAWKGAAWWGGWMGAGGVALSPALLGVGLFVGIRTAGLIFAGGFLGWGIGIPLLARGELPPMGDPSGLAMDLWSTQIRYIGVGAMLIGGLWSLLVLVRPLAALMLSSSTDRSDGSDGGDLPSAVLGIMALMALGGLALASLGVVGSPTLAILLTAILALAGFLFSAVASYMAGLLGSSHNPVSGMTIATILLSALLLRLLMGVDAAGGAGAVLLVGAGVCCAAALAGDNIQDLKAGALLGATPWRQQTAQIVGVISGSLVMAPVLILLEQAYGFGPIDAAHPHALPAPQAGLMAALATGVFNGDLPWDMILIGIGCGAAVIVVDQILAWQGRGFRVPVLAVAVGIYLPIDLSAAILLGGILGAVIGAGANPQGPGLLRAAGWITGEALAGIALAAWVVSGGTKALDAPPGGSIAWVWGVIALFALTYPVLRSRRADSA